jgi:hypothetical protein
MMKTAAAAAIAVVTLAPVAGAQSPPPNIPLPNLPSAEVARFKMTIHGSQTSYFEYKWNPGDGCGRNSEATLVEHWNYARGKAVVMEFSRLGRGVVLIRRQGRPPGDAAFAAPGDLTRHATGFFDMGPLLGCGGWHSLVGPDCDKRYKVQSEMHLWWFKGKLELEKSGHGLFDNPARNCGNVDGVLNFDELPSPYPALYKQRTKLSARQLFGKARGFKLTLKDRYLGSLGEAHTWPDSSDRLVGLTTLTFERLRKP